MKPNDKAIEAARAEGKRWQEGLNRPENQIPCWKVLREADDGYDGYDVIAKFNNREERDEALERLRAEAMVDAAYAAQFPPSKDYAGLIERLRLRAGIFKDTTDDRAAADALEAVLADRDALMAANAEFSVVFKERDDAIAERDALAARLQAAANRLEKLAGDIRPPNSVTPQLFMLANSMKQNVKQSDRNARLAPVDDEALVEIVARAICLNRASHACNCKEDGVCKAPLENLREYNEVWPQARAAIAAAIRSGK